MKTKKFTPEEREEYRREQREQGAEMMKQGVLELLSSEGWQKWAAMRARLHTYSFNNTMLILCQLPEATMVASGKFWIDHGRMMNKGTRALRVFAPLFRKPTPEEIAGGRKPEDRVLYAFKLVPVFDVSQTNGEELPIVKAAPLTGDSHAAYFLPLKKFALSLGYSVSFEELSEGMGGYCDHAAKHIAIAAGGSANQQVHVLIHEIAHALGIGYKEHGREQAEVLVETATFIVSTSIGLDTTGTSVPYVANWGEANAVAAIEAYARTVDEVARKIERACIVAKPAA
jgi:Putative metallopeptidase family (DUF6782)